MKDESVIVLGEETAVGGTYLLRIEMMGETAVRFGRFRSGEAIPILDGAYLYVGSAMRGLGSRLLRHASRVDAQYPHSIRPVLAEKLRLANIKGSIPQQKRLHWHVDYLLEQSQAALAQVVILRSQVRLEEQVAEWLMGLAETAVLAPGLGASDNRGHTHLLRIPNDKSWWDSLSRSRFSTRMTPITPITSS